MQKLGLNLLYSTQFQFLYIGNVHREPCLQHTIAQYSAGSRVSSLTPLSQLVYPPLLLNNFSSPLTPHLLLVKGTFCCKWWMLPMWLLQPKMRLTVLSGLCMSKVVELADGVSSTKTAFSLRPYNIFWIKISCIKEKYFFLANNLRIYWTNICSSN